MSSGQQFIRRATITVGDRQWTAAPDGLRVHFEIHKDLKPRSNIGNFILYGLTKESRDAVEHRDLNVIFSAGYMDHFGAIFAGSVIEAWSQRALGHGTDWETHVRARSQWRAFSRRYIDMAFGLSTPRAVVVKKLADAMGVVMSPSDAQQIAGVFENGCSVSGIAADYMDSICNTLGLEWSIDDGQLVIVRADTTTAEVAILITPETGLVGWPERHDMPQTNSLGNPIKSKLHDRSPHVKLTCLLNPELRVGRRVRVRGTSNADGDYRCEEIRHMGDTHGPGHFFSVPTLKGLGR